MALKRQEPERNPGLVLIGPSRRWPISGGATFGRRIPHATLSARNLSGREPQLSAHDFLFHPGGARQIQFGIMAFGITLARLKTLALRSLQGVAGRLVTALARRLT